MNEPEKNKVLMHSTSSSIAIPVNSADTNDQTFPSSHCKGNWARSILSSLYQCIPGVMNPHSKTVQICSKLFIFLFLVLFLLLTLNIFLMRSKPEDNCIIDHGSTYGAVLSNLLDLTTNIIFLLHIIFKFRVAYVDPESRVLVYDPKKVALNYLFGYFILDFFLLIPLPQKTYQWMIEMSNWSSGPVVVVYILQYLVLFGRLLSMFADLSTTAFVYESWLSKLLSKRMVRCLTNVEAFTLRAADLEEVFSFYSGLLINNPLVQGAIKKGSLYQKSLSRSKSY